METKTINYDVITSQKFTDDKWNLIEKPLSEIEKNRNDMIRKLGDDSIIIKNKSNMIMVGRYYYLKIREELVNFIKLPKKEKEKNNDDAKINKKTKMILENSYNTLIKPKLDIIFYYFNDDIEKKKFDNLIIKNNFIELRIIILLKLIDYYVKNPNFHQEEIEELLIACKKIIFNLKKDNKYEKICNIENFEIKLCDTFFSDFEFKINELSKICDIKLFEIANKRPKLIFDTIYDSTISDIKLKPYDTQIEFMDIIKNNTEDGYLIYMRVLTGLGKTSLITSVCNYVNNIKKQYKVIFCCSDMLETVRIQVAKLMFNFNIKFGIGTGIKNNDSTKDPTYQIKTSYNCGKINDTESSKNLPMHLKKLKMCDMIICDYMTTYMLLKDNNYEYILFFDEPTIKIRNNSVLEYLSRILYYAPKRCILTSTTLPQRKDIINFENNFKNKHQDAKVFDIISNKVLTSCTLKTFNNEIITPHIYCKDKEELFEYIENIKHFPLLGKFYSLTFLMNLNNFMKQYDLNIDLENIESFDQENIMENILILITDVCDNDCVDFELFKNIKCIDINENKFDNEIMTPHVYCNNVNDLIDFINNYFISLGKYYSQYYLNNLNIFMKEYKMDIVGLNKLEKLNQENITSNVLILLNRVCKNDSIDFKLFKNIKFLDISKNTPSVLYTNFYKLDHYKLLTSSAFKFFGCTLIATDYPEKYINKYFKDTLNKIKIKLKIKSMSDMLLDYKKSISLIDLQVDDIIKNIENDNDGVKDEMIAKAYSKKKKFPFPNTLKVNSMEHIENFSKYVKSYDKSLLRDTFNCEDIDITQFSVSDEIKLLLYMQVGVYCDSLDSNYTNKVLELLNENKLAYVICSENFCYGANFAINKIIITDEIGEILSLNSILQLIGRTSRVSKSYSGETYIDDKTMSRIINFFQNINNNNDESTIIREGFDNYKKYVEEKEINDEIKRIAKEKREIILEREREIEQIKWEEKQEKLRLEEELRIEKENTFLRSNKNNSNNDNNWYRDGLRLNNSTSNNLSIIDIIESKKSNSKLFGGEPDDDNVKESKKYVNIPDIKYNNNHDIGDKKPSIIDIIESKKSNSKLFGGEPDDNKESKILKNSKNNIDIIDMKYNNNKPSIIDIIESKKSNSKLFGGHSSNDPIESSKNNSKLFGFSKDLTEEQKIFRRNNEDRLSSLYKK
jgi:hypothetical protein